jgi:hypothetical protein
MLDLIKTLSKKPRIAGYNKDISNFLSKKLNNLGYKTTIKKYRFIGWKNIKKPVLKIDEKKVKVLPLIWSGSGKVKGKLKFVGRFKTFEAYQWFRWAIINNGKRIGYIISRPDMVWTQPVDNKSDFPYFMVYPNICKKLQKNHNIKVEGSVKNRFLRGQKIQNIITKNDSKNKIIICAHYDSMLGAPGANDNATGTAALLELASKIKDKHVQFILFDAEEWNKSGSYAYVKSLNKEEIKRIKVVMNIDMIGSKIGTPFIICSKNFNKKLTNIKNKINKKIKIMNDIRAPFDYWPFYKKGVKIIHFGASPYNYCHDPKDTIDKISLKPIKQVMSISENIIKEL